MDRAPPTDLSDAYGIRPYGSIRCVAHAQYLWRSPTLGSSNVDSFHDALFPQCHEISPVIGFLVDDTWPGNGRHGVAGKISLSIHQSADCFRACAVLLLRGALVLGSSD